MWPFYVRHRMCARENCTQVEIYKVTPERVEFYGVGELWLFYIEQSTAQVHTLVLVGQGSKVQSVRRAGETKAVSHHCSVGTTAMQGEKHNMKRFALPVDPASFGPQVSTETKKEKCYCTSWIFNCTWHWWAHQTYTEYGFACTKPTQLLVLSCLVSLHY